MVRTPRNTIVRMTCSLRLFALCLATLGIASIRMNADYNDYVRLGPDQLRTIVPSSTREVVDLSGPWQREIDGKAEGIVSLPATETQQGRVVYRRTVRIDAEMLQSHSWQLYFLGVTDEVELRINKRFVQRYPGGMVPFSARVPERLFVNGTNEIELVVNSYGEKTRLVEMFARSAQKNSMGLLREVFLVGTPHVWTNDVRAKVSIGANGATVTLGATITGGAVERLMSSGTPSDALTYGKAGVTVEAVLSKTRGGDAIARGGATSITIERARSANMAFQLTVGNPDLWSPSSPSVYYATIRIEYNGVLVDEYVTTIGLRTLSIATNNGSRKLIVNGSPMTVNAIEYIEEYPSLGPSMSYRQMEQDVSMMKTLGVNAVRFRHGSPHPYLLDLCDRYGLMVFVELPAADIPKAYLPHEEITARIKNTAERLITYIDAHPSVLAYGLSEGLQEDVQETADFHASLLSIFRSTGSKLVYKVVPSSEARVLVEGGFDMVLIRMCTTADRAYFAETLKDVMKRTSRAAIIPCFGAVVSPMNMNGFSDPLSNEAQAVTLRDSYKTTMSLGLAGIVVWSFNDYALEKPTMLVDHDDPYVCTSGLVDVWRQPRVSYAMLKSLINDEKEPLLQARDYSADTPLIFIALGIILALVLAFLVNRSRRFREYLLRSLLRPYNFYADIRDQRILSTVQTVILGAVIAFCVGLVDASLVYFLRTDALVEYLLHLLFPSNAVYEVLRFVAWRPTLAVITLSIVVFACIMILAVVLRISAMFIKGRIFFRDTLTITVWSALPLIILLPIGITLYKVLSTDAMSIWVPIIIAGVIVWFFSRTLRATAVVFDVRPSMVYGIGAGIFAFTTLALIFWYNTSYGFLSFLQYYWKVVSA